MAQCSLNVSARGCFLNALSCRLARPFPLMRRSESVVPGEYQWLLTLLSVFWSFGQLFAAFIGWAFVTNYVSLHDASFPCL